MATTTEAGRGAGDVARAAPSTPAQASRSGPSTSDRSSSSLSKSGPPTPGQAGGGACPAQPGAGRAATSATSATAGDTTGSSGATETASAGAAPQRGLDHDVADRDAVAPGDFAAMLAASNPTEAIAVPAGTLAAPAPTATGTSATDPAAEGLPDQMLALLSGAWAVPAAASVATTATVADSPAAPPHPATAQPGRLQLTAAAAPPAGTANAIGSEPTAAATVAVANGAAAERAVSDASTASADAPATLESFTLTAAAPTAAAARAGAPLPPTAPLALPADPDAGFDDGFGTRIAWMAEQRLGHAQIRLNPEHVGPIDVRVQLDGDRVSAEFHSAHAEVRQAIEASLPRLREMLGQHGLQLGQADVGQGQPGRRGDPMPGHGHDPAREAELDPHLTTMPIRTTRGLLDEYA